VTPVTFVKAEISTAGRRRPKHELAAYLLW
jgi:hypothetical protein